MNIAEDASQIASTFFILETNCDSIMLRAAMSWVFLFCYSCFFILLFYYFLPVCPTETVLIITFLVIWLSRV